MRISVCVGYWSAGPPPGAQELFEAAERAGVDQIWTAEAYGSDAWTPLAWWGSRTTRIKLGTAVSQLSARPPVTLAMTAMTMDHLTQGRVLLGIGTSNPQVVEGWYGQPYPRPLERTREYIDIVRKVIARTEPVSYDGKHYQIPLPPENGGTGLGKPLRSILHPYRTEIPIYLGAEGPKNVALAAEIADGWNVIFFSPAMNDFYAARPGRRLRPPRRPAHGADLRRGRRPDGHHRGRRPRARRRPGQAHAGPVHRRHGRPRGQLPPRGLRPDGLRGRSQKDPGPVPGRRQEERHRGRARQARRGRGPDRPLGQDHRRDPALEADRPDHLRPATATPATWTSSPP